jgi:drug/metabolite transporter (DMT)-like permease
MSWIIPAILLFISSVFLYLLVRKNQLENIPHVVSNLAMFAIPAVVFAGMNVVQGIPFYLRSDLLAIIFLAALFCSYLGNVFSLVGIDLSPNPGYSLIISKSYVVFTSVAAIYLFHSTLTLKSIFAILLIIVFSALITVSKEKKKKYHNLWVVYSLGAFFAWGILALVSTYLISQNVPVTVTLFWLSLFVSIFVSAEIFIRKPDIKYTRKAVTLFIAIGIASSIFNLCMQIGYKLAPNPGYINAANAASISLLTVMAHYFYKDELNIRKVIGIIGVTIGLIILFIK